MSFYRTRRCRESGILDNIHTYGPADSTTGGAGIVGSPTGPDDSILLPTILQGPTPPPIPGPTTFQRWIGTPNVVVVLIALGLIIWGIRAARRAPSKASDLRH